MTIYHANAIPKLCWIRCWM